MTRLELIRQRHELTELRRLELAESDKRKRSLEELEPTIPTRAGSRAQDYPGDFLIGWTDPDIKRPFLTGWGGECLSEI